MQVEQMTPELVKLVSKEHYGYAGAEGWMDEKNDYKRPFFFESEELGATFIVDRNGVSLHFCQSDLDVSNEINECVQYTNGKSVDDLDTAKRVVKALNGVATKDLYEFVKLTFTREEY